MWHEYRNVNWLREKRIANLATIIVESKSHFNSPDLPSIPSPNYCRHSGFTPGNFLTWLILFCLFIPYFHELLQESPLMLDIWPGAFRYLALWATACVLSITEQRIFCTPSNLCPVSSIPFCYAIGWKLWKCDLSKCLLHISQLFWHASNKIFCEDIVLCEVFMPFPRSIVSR